MDKKSPAVGANAQSTIAVMRDPIGTNLTGPAQYNHVPGGGNVLYIDAHVSGLKYDVLGGFPLNGACG